MFSYVLQHKNICTLSKTVVTLQTLNGDDPFGGVYNRIAKSTLTTMPQDNRDRDKVNVPSPLSA